MTVKRQTLKIGTRGSKLALTQTEMVRAGLLAAHPDLQTEIIVIRTSGDWTPGDGEMPLAPEKGGKALFAKELEEALLAGTIDAAVHSMKDMDSNLPPGLVLTHMLPRADACDILVFPDGSQVFDSLDSLPAGFRVGTASVRRASLLKGVRPDLEISPVRGNVDTRLAKLQGGAFDALVLALAGLQRLGLETDSMLKLDPDFITPCAGQGAVGIEIRGGDEGLVELLNPLSCRKTVYCVFAERAALRALGGSCRTPVGAYAVREGELMNLSLAVGRPDGSCIWRDRDQRHISSMAEAVALGDSLGQKLKNSLPPAEMERIFGKKIENDRA
ncbi:MAG: hydroxymethylbilane synthase [Alphaproteobacteria bacterium]|nr:hydroxymethylbilane synthase [Alphaproteobacteria bacterium]